MNQLQQAVALLIRLVIRGTIFGNRRCHCRHVNRLEMGLILLVATPVIALILYMVMSRSVPFYKKAQKSWTEFLWYPEKDCQAFVSFVLFPSRKRSKNDLNKLLQSKRKRQLVWVKLTALLNPLTYAVMNLAVVAILWFGGYRVDNGGVSQGNVIALVNYMTQTLLALIVVANLVVTFTKAAASASRVNEILDTQPAVTEQTTQKIEVKQTAKRRKFCLTMYHLPTICRRIKAHCTTCPQKFIRVKRWESSAVQVQENPLLPL